MAAPLLSPAQLNRALISQAQLGVIFNQVSAVAKEAIAWFDTARRTDQLASTKFTFTLLRFCDARVIYKDEKLTNDFGWFRKESNSFEVGRGGGPAYDQTLDRLGMHSFAEALDPNFPRQPTASLPVEQIITVGELTEEVFELLKRPIPQEVIKIDLSVQLFDLSENCIAAKSWVVQMGTSS